MNKPHYVSFNDKVFDKNNIKDIWIEKSYRSYMLIVEYEYQEGETREKALIYTTNHNEASKALNDVLDLIKEEPINLDDTFQMIGTAKVLSRCIIREETKEEAIAMLDMFHGLILEEINEHYTPCQN